MIGQAIAAFGNGVWKPHGFCINWSPELIWSYVISDTLISLAYVFIALALVYFSWRRKELQFHAIFLMFGAFIFSCGANHLLSIVMLWQPLYWLDAGMKMVTAAISIATAASLLWIIPKALLLPSPSQLQAEIADRLLKEEFLRESTNDLMVHAKQLTTLIEAIPDVIYLKDSKGRWQVANESAKRLFKLSDISWKGRTDQVLSLMSLETHKALEKCQGDDETVTRSGKLTVFEKQFIDDQEGIRDYELRKAPILLGNEEFGGLVVIGRDVTDMKRNEQYMRIADTTFEAQEGIVITDANNYIQRVNKAFTRLTGYAPEEVIGKTPAILKSGRHEKAFYQAMWDKLLTERFWQGEVWDRRKNGEIYPKWLTITAVSGPGGEITNFVGAFTDLSEHKEAEEAIYRLAFYDPLTDLPNRRLLRDRLSLTLTSSSRSRSFGAALLVDLDNFKSINDTKGHEIGDQILCEVAKRLKSCVRQGDTVARLGGDEFVIMLENLSTDETEAAKQAESVAEKVHESINEPYRLKSHELHSSPSIGICLFINQDITSDEIIKRADTAMYQAKSSGRNSTHFFDPDMQALLETRMSLETDLRHALFKNQLQLYYQVQVDQNSQVLGAEALLRWKHPQRGFISPAEFIPLAEDSGLILPIGEWVLHTACAQLKRWECNPATSRLNIAINVSAKQFRQSNFVEQICSALKSSGADATRLKLELTESVIVQNIADTIEKMQELKLIGIQFSMDDFGTGYSSLSNLKKLPLNQLKIDQSFVHDIVIDQNDAVIAQTIIGMSQNLGLQVIAEGVETEEQRACLERYGCNAFQGYLFSRPLPAEEFEFLLLSFGALDS